MPSETIWLWRFAKKMCPRFREIPYPAAVVWNVGLVLRCRELLLVVAEEGDALLVVSGERVVPHDGVDAGVREVLAGGAAQ